MYLYRVIYTDGFKTHEVQVEGVSDDVSEGMWSLIDASGNATFTCRRANLVCALRLHPQPYNEEAAREKSKQSDSIIKALRPIK